MSPSFFLLLYKNLISFVPGITIASILAFLSIYATRFSLVQIWGGSTLTLAIVFGILIGNTIFDSIEQKAGAGIDYCKSTVLRIAIILFGFRITFQEITGVGPAGIVIGVTIVIFTFLVAVWMGTRLFGLDRRTAILIGAGASICGAAAVVATQSIIRARSETVSIAVATVVVFGTVSMFIYPLLYPYIGFDEYRYGIFVGSTVHEVAQVVAAGQSIGDHAAAIAVIEKMLRVILLAPFLVILSIRNDATTRIPGHRIPIVIPWFAVLFIMMAMVNSLQLLPKSWIQVLISIDTFLLAVAMAALGIRTHFRSVREAGAGPLKLGAALCAFLVIGGYLINITLTWVLG